MKIGLRRLDALRGESYAVSAHLAEGGAAEELHARCPAASVLYIKGKEMPEKLGIAQMLAARGFEVREWDDTAEANGESIYLTIGTRREAERDADLLSSVERPLHVHWLTLPEDVFTLPARRVWLTLCDPTCLPPVGSDAWQAGIVPAIRLGVLLDKDLFGQVYSTFDPVTLCTRALRLIEDLTRGDAPGVRARLAFGERMAQVAETLAAGELTPAEALSVGMLTEAHLGAKLGVCTPRRLADLTGALAYHGLPCGVSASGEAWQTAFLAATEGCESISFTLPTAIGKCREVTCERGTIARLLGEMA